MESKGHDRGLVYALLHTKEGGHGGAGRGGGGHIHEGAGLAAGLLGDTRLVHGDGITHGAPPLVLDEGVGGLKGCSGDGRHAGDEGAGGADEGEEGGGLV